MACVKSLYEGIVCTHLASLAGVHPVVEPGCFIAADAAQYGGTVEFCNKRTPCERPEESGAPLSLSMRCVTEKVVRLRDSYLD